MEYAAIDLINESNMIELSMQNEINRRVLHEELKDYIIKVLLKFKRILIQFLTKISSLIINKHRRYAERFYRDAMKKLNKNKEKVKQFNYYMASYEKDLVLEEYALNKIEEANKPLNYKLDKEQNYYNMIFDIVSDNEDDFEFAKQESFYQFTKSIFGKGYVLSRFRFDFHGQYFEKESDFEINKYNYTDFTDTHNLYNRLRYAWQTIEKCNTYLDKFQANIKKQIAVIDRALKENDELYRYDYDDPRSGDFDLMNKTINLCNSFMVMTSTAYTKEVIYNISNICKIFTFIEKNYERVKEGRDQNRYGFINKFVSLIK